MWLGIEETRRKIDDTMTKLRSEPAKAVDPLREEIRELDKRMQRLRELVGALTVGDPASEVLGIAWIITGITLATFSEEIIWLLSTGL